MEQLINLYSSTVGLAGYTAGSGILVVASGAGLGTPGAGTFSISILDQSTFAVKVILRADYLGGTALAVTAETSDTNCAAGDIVVGSMLTARSIVAILEDWLEYNAQANLPSATGRKLGQRFKANDSPVDYVLDDGSNNSPATSAVWAPYVLGMPATPPDHTAFSDFNSGGTGITFARTNTGNWITIREQGSSTTGQICGSTKAKFASTFTAKMMFSAVAGGLVTDAQFGICVTDGTKFIIMALQWFNNGVFINVSKYTSATVFSADYQAIQSPLLYTPLLCFVVKEDATHRTWYVSPDGGRTLCQVLQTTLTDFLTTTGYGIVLRGDAASDDTALTLWSLAESNP